MKRVSPEVYRIDVVNQFDSRSIFEVDYSNNVEFLQLFAVMISYLGERVRFQSTKQKHKLNLAQYLSSLHSAVVNCKFKTSLEERLWDRFLAGLCNPDMREDIFKKHSENDVRLSDIVATAMLIEESSRLPQQLK